MNPYYAFEKTAGFLEEFIKQKEPADKFLYKMYRQYTYWGKRDRTLIAELFYGALRHKILLQTQLHAVHLENTLLHQVYAYTLLIYRYHMGPQLFSTNILPQENTQRWRTLENLPMPTQWSLRYSMPDLFIDSLERVFGDHAESLAKSLTLKAPVDLRVNTLKASQENMLQVLLNQLPDHAPQRTPWSPVGIRLNNRLSREVLASLQGKIEIQDEGSQLAALLCPVKPKQWVLDYCAGAGGKSLVFANQMQNTGQLFLTDTHSRRLDKAKKRLKNAGVHNAQTLLVNEIPVRYQGAMDVVVVDAPCSGTGTWRRNPDLKYRWTSKDDLAEIQDLQHRLLSQASFYVKNKGFLVYIICSLLPEENQDQVQRFLEENTSFTLISPATLYPNHPLYSTLHPYFLVTPNQHHTDGFFAALLQQHS